MVLAGSPFYTSGTFWAGAGTVAGLLGTIAVVWVTVRVANPRGRLFYSMPVATSLLNRRPDLSHELKVVYGDKKLDCPHIAQVELTSRGRRDIPREAFDDGNPIRLDVGAPIVECLSSATSPSDRPDPVCAIDGSTLLVGPSLIARRQTTVFTLLVDGPSPQLRNPQQSLIDVRLLPADPGSRPERQRMRLLAALGALIVLFIIEALTSFSASALRWILPPAIALVATIFAASVSLRHTTGGGAPPARNDVPPSGGAARGRHAGRLRHAGRER